MNNNLKIIIIGFGSIGQRHYANLLKLGYNQIEIFDPYYHGENKKVLKKMSAGKWKEFDVAFICSPNNWHIKHALTCAKNKIHLFIEKPLSHKLSGIETLAGICRKNHLITLVGCNMRFHPCIKFIKKYLDSNKLGKIYSISLEFGYYLPYWRPNQDYRRNYATSRKTGGGVILDDIHEFDLLFWFKNFTKVKKHQFIYNRSSSLKINTEDNCMAIFEFQDKTLGLVKCDYLQKAYSRSIKIVAEKGNIIWNFRNNIVRLENKKGLKNIFSSKNYNFNRSYLDEIQYYLSCLERNKLTFNDIRRGKNVLSYCLKK